MLVRSILHHLIHIMSQRAGIVPLKLYFSLKCMVLQLICGQWGAIMAELFTLSPLFPGISQVDQMHQICSVVGTPTKNEWDEGLKFASAINYEFPQCNGVPLSALIPSASEDAIDLITRNFAHGILARGQQLWRPFSIRSFRVAFAFRHRFPVELLSIQRLYQLCLRRKLYRGVMDPIQFHQASVILPTLICTLKMAFTIVKSDKVFRRLVR